MRPCLWSNFCRVKAAPLGPTPRWVWLRAWQLLDMHAAKQARRITSCRFHGGVHVSMTPISPDSCSIPPVIVVDHQVEDRSQQRLQIIET